MDIIQKVKYGFIGLAVFVVAAMIVLLVVLPHAPA